MCVNCMGVLVCVCVCVCVYSSEKDPRVCFRLCFVSTAGACGLGGLGLRALLAQCLSWLLPSLPVGGSSQGLSHRHYYYKFY